MFWRIVRRLLTANRGRLIVILLALGAGAAVTAALLNLQIDAKRRLTTEFRAFGPNILISPRGVSKDSVGPSTLPASIEKEILKMHPGEHVAPFLYLYGSVSTGNREPIPLVVVGMLPFTFDLLEPTWKIEPRLGNGRPQNCMVGAAVASHLQLATDTSVHISLGNKNFGCLAKRMISSGGAEDNQIFIDLAAAQDLASLPGRVSLIQLLFLGTPPEIEHNISSLQQEFPDADVRPIRQFTEAEGIIYNRISGLLTATVAVVLILTTLCVMAAMTNVAMERKNDVGLMKAIGGATRRVLRLFLAEAAVLGLIGGFLGAAAGILLSIGLGKAVFGVAAQPRLIVYPVAVTLTVIVAIAGAYPLRRLANIRPASVLRGE